VNVTDNVCAAPVDSTVPAAGVYANVPGTDAVAFNWEAPSGVPKVMPAGGTHVIVGVALVTVIGTLANACVNDTVSAGVKVVVSVCPDPANSTVPAAGLYANVPGTDAVAFSCVALSGVP
jgi:hypothetical protein